MPAFSLFAILGVDGLRLRLRNRCGLGLNRNLPFLDGHYSKISDPPGSPAAANRLTRRRHGG